MQIHWHFQFIRWANQPCFWAQSSGQKLLGPLTENATISGCKIFCCVALIQSTQFCQSYLECKRFMFLIKYFILFATVAMTIEIVPFSHFHSNHCQGDKFLQHITSTTVFMATKPGRMVSYLDWHPPIKLLNSLVKWLCKIIIFTTTVPMATKLGRTVTYLDGLPIVKLCNP